MHIKILYYCISLIKSCDRFPRKIITSDVVMAFILDNLVRNEMKWWIFYHFRFRVSYYDFRSILSSPFSCFLNNKKKSTHPWLKHWRRYVTQQNAKKSLYANAPSPRMTFNESHSAGGCHEALNQWFTEPSSGSSDAWWRVPVLDKVGWGPSQRNGSDNAKTSVACGHHNGMLWHNDSKRERLRYRSSCFYATRHSPSMVMTLCAIDDTSGILSRKTVKEWPKYRWPDTYTGSERKLVSTTIKHRSHRSRVTKPKEWISPPGGTSIERQKRFFTFAIPVSPLRRVPA